MLRKRGCGVLLHPTSLPGPEGVGTLGDDARHFIDILSAMGMSYWQVLPLSPPACGNSPYSAFSAFAGNPLMIDLRQLVIDGDLTRASHVECEQKTTIDFGAVSKNKTVLLRRAAMKFLKQEASARTQEFWHFCDTTPWLHDYALFMALKLKYRGKSWHLWPQDASLMTAGIYEKASAELGPEIGIQKYLQWQFFTQWREIREYASQSGIAIIGDLPIFVAYDSVDVWSHRELFLLDSTGNPNVVAGVPPDYFSADGQLWGNPLYNWTVMGEQGYQWWIERFRSMFSLVDIVRIDHFRGFEAAWHVPVGEKTARGGSWVAGPAHALFNALVAACGQLPIIAEDLGVITREVEELRDSYGFPGMKILQFGFDSGPSNPYLPHNYQHNCVVYTGTHDNDTTAGWYAARSDEQRRHVDEYLGFPGDGAVAGLLRSALMSVADTAVIPFQDLLGVGSEARMNVPGTADDNWKWRFSWDLLPRDLVEYVKHHLELYGRNQSTLR
ncbi:MAG TPA: 4-alpha-glucanotransferase [Desulfuromonadales bacterium]|nr:4-alpha-glucanotransferase [Desulfuromonadales bacterium]